MTINNINNNKAFQNANNNVKLQKNVAPINVSFTSIHEAIKTEKTTATVSSSSTKETSRQDKIAALKSQVANGTYSTDTRQVAQKLVNNNLV